MGSELTWSWFRLSMEHWPREEFSPDLKSVTTSQGRDTEDRRMFL